MDAIYNNIVIKNVTMMGYEYDTIFSPEEEYMYSEWKIALAGETEAELSQQKLQEKLMQEDKTLTYNGRCWTEVEPVKVDIHSYNEKDGYVNIVFMAYQQEPHLMEKVETVEVPSIEEKLKETPKKVTKNVKKFLAAKKEKEILFPHGV